MATKYYRTVYLPRDMEMKLVKHAEKEQSSASRLVRIALERFFKDTEEDTSRAKDTRKTKLVEY